MVEIVNIVKKVQGFRSSTVKKNMTDFFNYQTIKTIKTI
jgi:hypothetical protein